jgi:hypothetical protein
MGEKPKTQRVEIIPMGSYVDLDPDGYIINPTGIDKIQPHWSPVIQATLDFYKETFGEDLHAFFIRGSVAKGQAVDGISDLDTLAYVRNREQYDDLDTAEFRHSMPRRFPFVEGVEILYKPVEAIQDDGWLLIQALQLYGEPIAQPRVKPGNEMISNAKNIIARMQSSAEKIEALKEHPDPNKISMHCVWLMKEFLRIGVQLTYSRSGRFTRDLYLCYKDFAEYYPEQAENMYEVLDLALNPTEDLSQIIVVRESVLPFLQAECTKLGIIGNDEK